MYISLWQCHGGWLFLGCTKVVSQASLKACSFVFVQRFGVGRSQEGIPLLHGDALISRTNHHLHEFGETLCLEKVNISNKDPMGKMKTFLG